MLEFLLIFTITVIIKFIPIIKIPFNMLATYFHELGHGLMAIATFGGIDKITLNLDGSGRCHLRYKNEFFHFLIALAGYIATSVFGYSIYYFAKMNSDAVTIDNMYIILGIIAVSIVLWVRDAKTFFLVLSIMLLFSVPLIGEFSDTASITEVSVIYMQLIGMYVMLDGLVSPFHLVDGKDDGDGGDLQRMTGIPEGVWIALWVCIAIYTLYQAYLLG